MDTDQVGALLGEKETRFLQGAAVLGLAAFLLGLHLEPARAWADLLIANFYFTALSLAALVFVAIQHLSKAGWPTVFRRVPEAMAAYLPVGAALTALLYFGMHDLYHWTHEGALAHDAVLKSKAGYLNITAYFVRAAVFFALWGVFSWALRRESTAQDHDGDVKRTARSTALSAGFLIVFGLTFSLASIDWIMSLEPHWYSTIFPWYVFGGVFVHGVAGIALLLLLLRRRWYFQEVNRHHLHDLGKYLFAFSVFWAYLWFSQYLLIWYSNIPEETAHYVLRSGGGWKFLFWANPAVNLLLPFFMLISARAKSAEKRLLIAGAVLCAGHWLDLYLMVMPAVLREGPAIGWLEFLPFAGLGAVFLIVFDRSFRRAAAVPARDPYLVESLHHQAS